MIHEIKYIRGDVISWTSVGCNFFLDYKKAVTPCPNDWRLSRRLNVQTNKWQTHNGWKIWKTTSHIGCAWIEGLSLTTEDLAFDNSPNFIRKGHFILNVQKNYHQYHSVYTLFLFSIYVILLICLFHGLFLYLHHSRWIYKYNKNTTYFPYVSASGLPQ